MRWITVWLAGLVFFSYNASAQGVELIDVAKMEYLIHEKTEKIRIINFWATWCKPCIEEMAYFETLHENKEFSHVEIILISLDFADDLEEKVQKFISRRGIKSPVFLLDNTDYNSWINLVDPSWSGAIPATLIIQARAGKRYFLERQLKEGELQELIRKF